MRRALLVLGGCAAIASPMASVAYSSLTNPAISRFCYFAVPATLLFATASIVLDDWLGPKLYSFADEAASEVSRTVGVGLIVTLYLTTAIYAVAYSRIYTIVALVSFFVFGLFVLFLALRSAYKAEIGSKNYQQVSMYQPGRYL